MRRIILSLAAAVVMGVGLVTSLPAAAQAYSPYGWGYSNYDSWRAWREHQWRERQAWAWRHHQWREWRWHHAGY